MTEQNSGEFPPASTPALLEQLEAMYPALAASAAQVVSDHPDEARAAIRAALRGDLGPIQALMPAVLRPQEPTSPPSALPAAEPLKAPQIAPEPLEEWNPLASLETTEHSIPSSGGRATVLLRPWSGRERLAYEDQLLVSFLIDTEAGESTVRLGQMRLVGTSLTLQGSTGFPVREDGSAMFSGDDKVRVREELLSLAPAVYSEVRDLALTVQPLPTARVDSGDDDGEGGEGDSDPSPTPSTPATVDPRPAS